MISLVGAFGAGDSIYPCVDAFHAVRGGDNRADSDGNDDNKHNPVLFGGDAGDEEHAENDGNKCNAGAEIALCDDDKTE